MQTYYKTVQIAASSSKKLELIKSFYLNFLIKCVFSIIYVDMAFPLCYVLSNRKKINKRGFI